MATGGSVFSTDALAATMVIHAGFDDRAAFGSRHVKGSLYFDLARVERLPLYNVVAEDLASALNDTGIACALANPEGGTLLVYGKGMLSASRFAHMLLFAGVALDRIKVLDGGLVGLVGDSSGGGRDVLCECGGTISEAASASPRCVHSRLPLLSPAGAAPQPPLPLPLLRSFNPSVFTPHAAVKELVSRRLETGAHAASPVVGASGSSDDRTCLLSVRSWPEYTGRITGYAALPASRVGDLPTSVWCPGTGGGPRPRNDGNEEQGEEEEEEAVDVQTIEGFFQPGSARLKSRGKLAELLSSGAITPERYDRVIAYCGTGWRASLAFFVLLSVGFPLSSLSVYDGGWWEWSGGTDPEAKTTNPIVVRALTRD